MNSASVAGGAAPDPEHSSFPDPQSPVRQVNFPSVSVEQSVLPQNLPPHETGALIVRSSPFWRTNPVVGSGGTPALDKIPGQTVYSHLFSIMKLVDLTPVDKTQKTKKQKSQINHTVTVVIVIKIHWKRFVPETKKWEKNKKINGNGRAIGLKKKKKNKKLFEDFIALFLLLLLLIFCFVFESEREMMKKMCDL